MLKFVLKFLPLIVHELADMLFDHLSQKQKQNEAKKQ